MSTFKRATRITFPRIPSQELSITQESEYGLACSGFDHERELVYTDVTVKFRVYAGDDRPWMTVEELEPAATEEALDAVHRCAKCGHSARQHPFPHCEWWIGIDRDDVTLARDEAQNEVNILSADLAVMRGRLGASQAMLDTAQRSLAELTEINEKIHAMNRTAVARAVDAEIEVKRAHDENKLLRAQKKRITNDLAEMTKGRDKWYARAKNQETYDHKGES